MTRLSRKTSFASVLLCACMFASGACGIILEYVQASLASMILGNSFEQWAMVIGLMLFWMGFGSLIQAQIPKEKLIYTFIGVETGLALVGGFSPTLTYLAYGYTAHYGLVLYFFVSFIGIMIGLEIPVIIRINNDFSDELSTNLGNILSADYIGSLVGALIYVFVLLRFTPITEAAFLTAGINFLLAFITFIYFSKAGLIHKKALPAIIMVITFFAVSSGIWNNREWNLKIEQPLYDDPIILSRTSQYQHIVITHYTPFDEVRLFLNGNLQFCSTDEARYHEPMVHPIMNLAPVRSKVLILGGGDGCALREVLKYEDVKHILLVDLDPDMTHLARTDPVLTRINQNAFKDSRLVHMAGAGVSPGDDRRIYKNTPRKNNEKNQSETQKLADVKVMNIDADRFLSAVPGFWDVIIIDLPDPSTPELTKLYSKEFYKKIKQHLSQHGLMVVQATSPYLAKESYLCIGRTIQSADLAILPFHENVPSFGDWGWFLAWHANIDSAKITRRIDHLTFDIPTRYITPEVFKAELVFGKGQLETRNTQINTLLFPVLLSIYNHESWLVE
ncbi:MAG: polyamine aminopropyltransferase [Proteobacteria bacterium]|nr:polyamine aminopropyltransferase [Pseudomonadota bacterium]MBU1386250.1 polyamine aminopropyltransferase [Pseudomonadota bacterium]MBU1542943.1 polyamine aminopropyltransferase [Pseudomonadota bacterium]MBU2429374.1 polyamine aminopropyltransferase [Pseudomonadota bacterium]MBU2481606.1 polyamine aminopropyltransferase [Pseudomonadota bacterium]